MCLVGLARARDVIQVINEERSRAKAREGLRLSNLPGERADAVECPALRVNVGVAELSRDAQEFVAMLVTDAGRDGDGNDPAEDGGPEGVNELFVVREQQDQFVAA